MYVRDLKAKGFERLASLPVFFRIGEGLLPRLSDILNEEGMDALSLLVLGGQGRTPTVSERSLEVLSTRIVGRIEVLDNTESQVESAVRIARDLRPNALIGVGGGRVIDVSKMVSYAVKLPLLVVPTRISNDGISSPISIIRFENEVKSVVSRVPTGIVIDLDLVSQAPETNSMAGVGDLLSNLSATEDWELAHEHGREKVDSFASTLSRTAAEKFLYFIKDEGSVDLNDTLTLRHLAEGLIMSGVAMALAGTSRPASGAEHLISHALDALLDEPRDHGIQVGVASLFTHGLRGSDWRTLRDTYKKIGFPTSPQELGISKETFLEAVRHAPETRPGRFTVLDMIEDPEILETTFLEVYGK